MTGFKSKRQMAQERTNVTKEALKLALEALQFALHIGFPESSESQIKKGEKAYQQHRAAITAIKQALAQPEEQNFCPRCGKRTADIHTCTPPQENTWQTSPPGHTKT